MRNCQYLTFSDLQSGNVTCVDAATGIHLEYVCAEHTRSLQSSLSQVSGQNREEVLFSSPGFPKFSKYLTTHMLCLQSKKPFSYKNGGCSSFSFYVLVLF